MEATNILDRALREYKPLTIIISYSGGYDSMVAGHLTARWARRFAHSANVKTASVDTLLSADGYPDFVRQSARAAGMPPVEVWTPTDKMIEEWHERIVAKGLAWCRSQHHINYYYLKQSVFRRMVAHYSRHRYDRVLFVNGVRRAESPQRRNAPEHGRNGNYAYCNPLVHWSDKDIEDYRYQNDLPKNPFYDIGNSRDCLCNWHTQFDLDTVRRYAKKALIHIERAHRASTESWGYGYGEVPRNGTFHADSGVQMDLPGFDEIPNLCSGCAKPSASNEARDYRALQNWGAE